MNPRMAKERDARPRILISNDDGVSAKGLRRLVEFVKELGEILVVAPDAARSGQSGAISACKPLRITKVDEAENVSYYACNGTPVDCVKLALHCFRDFRPDIVLSGINHGSNSGVSVLYSGTMGVAQEGCVVGIPSIGFSLLSHDADADFEPCREIVCDITRRVLTEGLPPLVCLNVNIPTTPIQGVRVCRQARGYWSEEFELRPMTGENADAYWLTGHFVNTEPNAPDTDEYLLSKGYVSVVPCCCDMTAYADLSYIQSVING